jgi:undecaprenyl diphosphate synthase
MDGNRRWAAAHDVPTVAGYHKGLQAVQTVIGFCIQKKIDYLSLYVFSIQNVQRATKEKDAIFTVMLEAVDQALAFVKKHNVRVFFVGDRALFPEAIQSLCARVEQETAQAAGLQLALLFGYGGQEEIVDAVKKVAGLVQQSAIAQDAITPQLLAQHMWTAFMPPPDLIIRTGNAQRISNFLLFQAAYAELYFFDCMWPDINYDRLQEAYTFFISSKRNFGL